MTILRHSAHSLVVSVAVGLLAYGSAATAADEVAPDFTLQDVNAGKGRLSLSQFTAAGKTVLLSFWSSTCQPCQVEMPHLQRLWETYEQQGLQVLAISIDDARTRSMIKPMCRRAGATFPVLHDSETRVVAKYHPAKTLPYTVIIDKQGRIVSAYTSYSPGDEVALEAEVCRTIGLGPQECGVTTE